LAKSEFTAPIQPQSINDNSIFDSFPLFELTVLVVIGVGVAVLVLLSQDN